MATDALGKKMYDCRIVNVERLDELVWDIYRGRTDYTLLKCVCKDLPKNIDWKRLRHIRVIGDYNRHLQKNFEWSGISQGFWVNAEGTWMLILPGETHLEDYFIRCGEEVESLWIFNSWMDSLNVGNLPDLKELLLLENPQLENIKWLNALDELNRLNLSGCSRLTDLDLSQCTFLTKFAGLESLTNLTSLNLFGCFRLTALPGLEKLTRLTSLNLSGCSSLKALPGLEKLTGLTRLDISGCSSLTALPGLENLTRLTKLSLYSCRKLTALPEGIRKLSALRLLNLQDMRLNELPDWLPEIAEKFTLEPNWFDGREKAIVSLWGTTVEGVDMSIFEQPYEMVVKWFDERKKGTSELLNEIKVIFLGNGDVGKTHTIARLMENGGEPPRSFTGSSTPGIVIEHKKFDINGQEVQVHFWDFGGQDILYSMHRMFMTRRTVYVVMVDARNESKSAQAREWLDTVKSFAPDAPVMLVINKNDQNPGVTIDETSLKREYPNLKTVMDMSALKDSKEVFNNNFTAALLNLIQESDILKEAWPRNWKRVKEQLQNMTKPYIFSQDYEKICAECEAQEDQEGLLGWFNDLGISFCQYKDFRLKNYVILRPDWITNAVYTILFNKKKDVDNGMISLEEINSLLNPTPERKHKIKRVREETYAWQDISYVLDVVRKFSLSYAADRNTEFFPMLCKEDSKPIAQTYAEAQDTLEFHMEFEYLPNNVLHRLMVMRWAELDLNNIWLTGARFIEKHTGLSAVVRIEKDILKIFVRANRDALHAPNTYLSVIAGTVDQIRMDLKLPVPKKWLVYKLEGKQDIFDYEELADMMEDGESEKYARTWRRKLPIKDIMNQAEPAVAENEMKLLTTIVEACQDLQGSMMYWGREENERNTVVRNKLRPAGYIVYDQTLEGRSGGGKRAGELDMDIRVRETTPWTICEALILKDGGKSKWNEHLEKLLDNYNTHGLDFLVLLCYVDCDKQRFFAIWEGENGYTTHIPKQGTENFCADPDSFEMVPGEQWAGNNLIKVAKCQYHCGGSLHTVYHLFIHMDKKPQ